MHDRRSHKNCFVHLFSTCLQVKRQYRGALGAAAPSEARTVFIKKCKLLKKNAYYNM
jgi:hypothetical protein